MARNLRDKVIAITGASAGIGAATATACAAAGMDVALGARREDRLREVADQVEAHGRTALIVPCDVTRDGDVQRLIDSTRQRFGRLDAVFANAGHGLFGAVTDTDEHRIREIFEVNFWGTVRSIKAAMPALRWTKEEHTDALGHVLICSSAVSEVGLPMYGYYAATKAAQDAIGSALRGEMARLGIKVSSVHPIGTKTEFYDVVQRISKMDGPIRYNTPGARPHDADVVARAVVRCLRRPRAEVWPGWLGTSSRLGLAMITALPAVAAWAMRRFVMSRYDDRRELDGDAGK